MDFNILLPLNLIGQFFFSKNRIIHITQLGKKVMAKRKRQKIIQSADTEAMFYLQDLLLTLNSQIDKLFSKTIYSKSRHNHIL